MYTHFCRFVPFVAETWNSVSSMLKQLSIKCQMNFSIAMMVEISYATNKLPHYYFLYEQKSASLNRLLIRILVLVLVQCHNIRCVVLVADKLPSRLASKCSTFPAYQHKVDCIWKVGSRVMGCSVEGNITASPDKRNGLGYKHVSNMYHYFE